MLHSWGRWLEGCFDVEREESQRRRCKPPVGGLTASVSIDATLPLHMADDAAPSIPQAVIESLLASGFPLQTAIAEVAATVRGCSTVYQEWPWRDRIDADQFLDLVVEKIGFSVCIEVKKTRKEHLTFLLPQGTSGDALAAQIVYATPAPNRAKCWLMNGEFSRIYPPSHESGFCVLTSGAGQRMLEGDARRIVQATDAFARHRRRTLPVESDFQLFLPVIVTNGPLFVAAYDPKAVSLETGELPRDAVEMERVPAVRFRKAFATPDYDQPPDRTVWVVSATALTSFLETLAVSTNSRVSGQVRVTKGDS